MTVLSLRTTSLRHRRLVVALCAVLAFGVAAHHAMPDGAARMASMDRGMTVGHHATAGMTLCLAVVGLVGLVALAAAARWRVSPRPRLRSCRGAPVLSIVSTTLARARAGPGRTVVLRL